MIDVSSYAATAHRRRHSRNWVIPLVVGTVWLTVTMLHSQESPKRIREIRFIRHDVFPEIRGNPRFLYEWANAMHVVTRESVIRRELLFSEGDEYERELLDESERKLRRLPYLGEASITILKEGPDFVDLQVVTHDQWSTLLSWILESGGGRTILGGSIEEFNLFGHGKRVFVEVSHEVSEGTTFRGSYTDPQFLSSRWTGDFSAETGPFVRGLGAQITRPFFSLDTPWALGFSGSLRNDILRLFSAGAETSRVQLESQSFQVTGARALGGRFRKTKLQLSYRFQNRDFSELADLTTIAPPEDELIHALSLAASYERVSFAKEQQIDRFLKTEDLTLGSVTSVSIGRTGLPIPKGVMRFEIAATTRHLYRPFDRQYVQFVFGFQTLIDKDTITSLRVRYYNKLLKRQTIAFNLELDYGVDLETSRQFLLGGDSGLRGYPARQFTGDKRFLINLEDRIFTPWSLLTVAMGAVAFIDAGYVWNNSEPLDFQDLRYSVGFGLRLGYTKSPRSQVGRIDFGWALNDGGGFGLSIGVNQLFSIN